MANEQRKWDIARENLLKALEILIEFRDQHNAAIAFRSLARLWKATTDGQVPAAVAQILGITQGDAEELLGHSEAETAMSLKTGLTRGR